MRISTVAVKDLDGPHTTVVRDSDSVVEYVCYHRPSRESGEVYVIAKKVCADATMAEVRAEVEKTKPKPAIVEVTRAPRR